MQEATFTPTTSTSRRGLFGAAGAMLLLAAPAAGAAKAQELDGELLKACADYEALQKAFEKHHAGMVGHGDEAFDNATDLLTDQQFEAIDRIIACDPPRTPEGLRSLAHVAKTETYFEAKPSRSLPVEETASRAQMLALAVLRSVAGEG